MKLHIFYNFTNLPYGGSNQFLSLLKRYFVDKGIYAEEIKDADIILFNSHSAGADRGNVFSKISKLKLKYPKKIFLHRVDGPVSIYQNTDKIVDKLIYKTNYLIADGTIFQSEWSKQKNYELGMKKNHYETLIMNAPDPDLFNRKEGDKDTGRKKIRLIAVSWSKNLNKGFDIYKFLDENLDFKRFDMTFVGNSPVPFKNIRHIKPLKLNELSSLIKEHDIFIFASKIESCSNSLLEALHCGLPAVAYNGSSNPEIVKGGGELFNSEKDILEKIDRVAFNIKDYKERIEVAPFGSIAERYCNFMERILSDKNNGAYVPKRISGSVLLRTIVDINMWKAKGILSNMIRV